MKCLQCGGTMSARRANYLDKEIGLPNVTLVGVEIRRCKNCGEEEVVIPRVEALHRAVAKFIIEKPGRLTGVEARFLRKHLGWSSGDFARHMGVAPETVSRWEHGGERIGPSADRLLRMFVAHLAPIDSYPIERLDAIEETARPLRLRAILEKKHEWELAAV